MKSDMAWNDQTPPVFNDGQNNNNGQSSNGPLPNAASPLPANQYPSNPIYPQTPPQQLQQQPLQQQPQAGQASRMPADGAYSGQALLGAQPGQDSDRPDSADDIWIDRTKRVIIETQNDPHRQVQLVQHLSVLYLKERFNREVQADKG